MGHLHNGKWIVDGVIPKSDSGEFQRQEQKFRGQDVEPESGRYHLYVSYACPWAHRALIMRKLHKLENVLTVSVVSPYMLQDGWSFEKNFPGVTEDSVLGCRFLREVYTAADPEFSGKVTVPVLFDKKEKTIVNNESSEVIRILNQSFQKLTKSSTDYYPRELKQEIDFWNDEIYENINNGVYKTGFAQKQEVYEEHFRKLFQSLDKVEGHLKNKDYLVGNTLTEADIRLYTTLVRFDPVYYVHFKCNRNLIREFKNLSRYLKQLYAIDAFKETTHFDHIKTHYYYSHQQLNPMKIIPIGPSPLVSE